MRILLVDDSRAARKTIARVLCAIDPAEVVEAESLDEALMLLANQRFDLALIDLRLSDDASNRDGLRLIEEARKRAIVPWVVSGLSDINEIRAAMQRGARDFLLKEYLSKDLILPAFNELRRLQRLEKEVIELRAARSAHLAPGLVGTSVAMQRLREQIQRFAVSDRAVLVTGPTGSGKELVVRAIHALGPSPDSPFLALNCGAINPSLVESELFGHARGAFTGAVRQQDGFFGAVGTGLLFLDEIGELSLDLQARLLRVLESRTFHPIGSTTPAEFKGRVVAATHVDLDLAVRSGRFRQDLFYRLAVLELKVPALQDHREDIPALVANFATGQPRPLAFASDAIEYLQARRWPGNVRELRNLIDKLGADPPEGVITAEAIRATAATSDAIDQRSLADLARELLRSPARDKFRAAETALLKEALRITGGNRRAAARLLGVECKAVERRADRLGDEAEA